MASNWIDKQFDEIKKLAEERFSPLSTAETKMLRAAIAGEVAWCGASNKNDDPHNDPSSHERWAADRDVRAELLRWLCLDKAAEAYVDPRGIRVHGASIVGPFDLSGAILRFPLVLNYCRLTDNLKLISAELAFLDLSSSSANGIRADRVEIKGNLFLGDKFTSHGEINLSGARIEGSFVCEGGIFLNPPQQSVKESGTTLNAERIRVAGNVNLRNGFHSNGEVWLLGAQIGGDLDCSGGIFHNPVQQNVQGSGRALTAQNIRVGGDVYLRDKFRADGVVWLLGAQIENNLDCSGGVFKNPIQKDVQESGTALQIASVTVKGNVHLRNDFIADGCVSLIGARINSDLECHDATFGEVIGLRMSVQRTLFWNNIKNPHSASLDLQDASALSLLDDQASWPAVGRLSLDGFTYGRIAEGPKDSKSRLEWLNLQAKFTPQPYRQLAKVLREDGDDAGARCVLYEMEKRKGQYELEKRKQEARKYGGLARLWNFIFRGTTRFWNLIFRGTIGYGIYPRRALWWLLLLIVLGWATYWSGYSRGAITPTNKEAYEAFHTNGGPPPNYQHFSALVYSAEHCFPLVNLGQKEAWTPDPNRLGLARFLRVFRWSQIFLGWALATFFVAGVTGIARKD